MSHEGHPACNLPQPPPVHKHLHVPHPAAGSLGMPPGKESMSLCRWLVSTCRKPVRLCKIGRKHTYFSSWDQQRGSTKLSFAGSKDTCVLNRSVISDSLQLHGLEPTRFLCPWDFPGKNPGWGCHFLLQGILPTQRLNPGLLH